MVRLLMPARATLSPRVKFNWPNLGKDRLKFILTDAVTSRPGLSWVFRRIE